MILELSMLGVIIIQQIYFMIQIHRLVNKLMSRSFHEYRVADTVKPRETKKEQLAVKSEEPEGSDTLASLQSIF